MGFNQDNRIHQRLHVLVYPSGVDVASSVLRFLTQQLWHQRRAIGFRWRRLRVGRKALLTLTHLRMGHAYIELAAGFGIGTTTAYRYVTEAVEFMAVWFRRRRHPLRTSVWHGRSVLRGKPQGE